MTSKERLNKILSPDLPDRVPISTYELVGYNSLSFENKEPSYKRLMKVIRQQTDCICMWNPSSNEVFASSSFNPDMEVETKRLGTSTVTKKRLHTAKGDLTFTSRKDDHIHTVWTIEPWCKNIEDVEKALSVPYQPLDYDASDYERIKNEVGDNGIIMTSLADPLWLAASLMEFGDYTIWAMTETEHFGCAVEVMHARNMENLKKMLEVNVVDLYRICGPEYATPPFLPPQFFERLVTPYVSRMVELIHTKGGKVRLHCHGKINEVLDLIVATGADALDPCEGPPDGDITLAEVKKKVGDKVCLFGNIQLKALEHASAEEIKRIVRECMEAARPGGGYCIMPTAGPINVPLAKKTEENYLTFINTARELGAY